MRGDAPRHIRSARFALGLGSNLGDSVATLVDAIGRLAAAPGVQVVAVSPLYLTEPVGGVAQPDFRNAVVVGQTTLSPRALLRLAHDIEHVHGRTRDVRWGPRTLDVDVLSYDDVHSADPALTLPHPRAHERAFVLVPWAEADPAAILPGYGPVAEMAARVDRDGLTVDPDPRWVLGAERAVS